MVQTIFISGIGTDIGKTVVSAIITEALQADYWKPIQTGDKYGTDSEWVQSMLSNKVSHVYPEVYRLKLPASPQLAATNEGIEISLEKIYAAYTDHMNPNNYLIIEGAGGLMVPLNDHELVIDLIRRLNAKTILVSRNYPGSINHSLLTAQVCRQKNIQVLGWVFNDQFLDHEEDILRWSGYPRVASIGKLEKIDPSTIKEEAEKLKETLLEFL